MARNGMELTAQTEIIIHIVHFYLGLGKIVRKRKAAKGLVVGEQA